MSDAEAAEECKKLGTKSALGKLVILMRNVLKLISFFTTGADEVRQWSIRQGTKAPQAAGVIHSGLLMLPFAILNLDGVDLFFFYRFRENLYPGGRLQIC